MLELWWKRAGYSRAVVGETGRRAWRGACERREAFTRVGVKVCGQWCPGSDKGLV